MMLPSLVLALLQTPAPEAPRARLVAASLFKNGFAITQRVIDVARPGTTTVLPVPQGAMGTLWFTPSEGTVLESVVVENEAVTMGKLPAGSVEEIIALNLGRTVTLLITEAGPPARLTCKLVSVAGSIVVVETAAGNSRVLSKGAIIGVEGKGLKSQSALASQTMRRVMRVRTLGKPGRISVVALERNLTWSPAYAVNLLPDGKNLGLVAKATIINDLEKLVNLDCRFVTGFPNLPYAETLDPLVAWAMGGAPGMGGSGGAFTNGGFGGQQGGRLSESRRGNVGYSPDDAVLAANAQAPDGESLGELFFYRRPGVSVDIGGRAAYTLFRTTTPYEAVYAWDIGDPAPGQPQFQARIIPPNTASPEEIWQTLRFVNNTKVPFTTGPATTFSEGEIVGQDALKYVSPGQTAELRVTRSLDVSADYTEEETARERGFIKGRNGANAEYPIFDRVTARGTLSLVNRKKTAIKVRIRKAFTGEWIAGDGKPEVKTTAAGLRQPNPTGSAEWMATVEPGATLTLTYTVRLLVSS